MSKIKELEVFNRPREKALREGISSLSDKELLALFIRCGTKDYSALDISAFIIDKYQSLSNVFKLDIYNLMKIKGIKKAKAVEIIGVIELAKRISKETVRKILIIKDASDVLNLVKEEVKNESQEHFLVLFLNIKLKLIKKEILFKGGEVSSIVDVNLLFKKAIMCGARKIICVHNHPSGDPYPSNDDIGLTNKIRKIAQITNIELLDHIIIAENDYFSFKQMEI